jgi:hypothetical protein
MLGKITKSDYSANIVDISIYKFWHFKYLKMYKHIINIFLELFLFILL